jgi:hypothetical protein
VYNECEFLTWATEREDVEKGVMYWQSEGLMYNGRWKKESLLAGSQTVLIALAKDTVGGQVKFLCCKRNPRSVLGMCPITCG